MKKQQKYNSRKNHAPCQLLPHSRTQSPSYARSTERDEGLWPNPYQTGIWLATTKVIVLITYISFTMFLWFPVLDLARAPRRTARKKGSGYENAFAEKHARASPFPHHTSITFSYPEPFLRAVRRGALAKSKTGNHKNMVKDIYVIRTITFVVANQMPVWYGFGQSPLSRSVDRA